MLKKIIIFLVLVIAVFFLGSGHYLNISASLVNKESEEIDRDGFGNSLLVDGKNIPQTSYILDNGELIFAQKNAKEWRKEIVAKNAFAGHETSISNARDNTVSILYINKKNQLNLTTKNNEKWKIEKIFGNAALSCSLIFDNKKNPHISFWSPRDGLSYANKKNGKWYVRTLDYGEVGWWNDIALDKKQIPHISYFDFRNGGLLYLTLKNGTWNKENVDFGKDVGRWNSIVVDKDDNIFISYIDSNTGSLKMAKKTKGGWLIEKIDDSQTIGEDTNISLDNAGNPVIAYSGLSDNTFRIAKKIAGSWSIFLVESSTSLSRKNIKGDIGGNSSLFIDSQGKAYLLWQDLSKEKLKYIEKKF